MVALCLGTGVDFQMRRWRGPLPPLAPAAPELVRAPQLIGMGRIGEAVRVDPGLWRGVPAPRFEFQWWGGAGPVAGAAGPSHVPSPDQDRTRLACAVTAINASGRVQVRSPEIPVTHVPPALAARPPDAVYFQNSGVQTLNASSQFTGAGLTFGVAGDGVSIHPDSGEIRILTDALQDGLAVRVTATNSGGEVTGTFRVTIQAEAAAPVAEVAPTLAGPGEIGAALTVDPGVWTVPASALAFQWRRDGVDIPGAVQAAYVPEPADDLRDLTCAVTATSAGGSLEVVTGMVRVTYAAPTAQGGLADAVFDFESGEKILAAGSDFIGGGLRFVVTGAAASIDAASGEIRLSTDALRAQETVTVTAENSGGTASSAFRVTVAALAPVLITAPTLSGTPEVGGALALDPGLWGGRPAPDLAFQWRRNGTAIPGATGLVYGPEAADDGAALSCAVTAINAGGVLEAVTEPLTVTAATAAPETFGAIADVVFEQDGAVRTVSAQAAFRGADLIYALEAPPEGVTIDAGVGLVSILTTAPIAARLTVRASNAAGSAVQSFAVTVRSTRTVFDAGPALGDVTFLWKGGAPAWTHQPEGFARLVPSLAGQAHGVWAKAAGDGLYRCLARWSGASDPQTVNRPFSFGARLRKVGTSFFGIRIEAFEISRTSRQLQLRQYTGGGDGSTAIASAPVAWNWDAWTWIEVEVAGNLIKARLYPETAAAPAWQAEGVTNQTEPGAFGPGGFPRYSRSPVIDIRRLEYVALSGVHNQVIPAVALDTDWTLAQSTERT